MALDEMRKKIRKFLWAVAVVLALLLVFFIIKNRTNYVSNNPDQNTATVSPGASGKPSGVTVKGLTVTNVTPNLSYTKATAKYANRLQFDASCSVVPHSKVVLKNGATVMFDNRSSATRSINLDGYRFTLRPYAWAVYTIKSSTLPRDILIDCDKGQNNGTISLEK